MKKKHSINARFLIIYNIRGIINNSVQFPLKALFSLVFCSNTSTITPRTTKITHLLKNNLYIRDMKEVIYICKEMGSGFYLISYTDQENLKKELKELEKLIPMGVKLVISIPTENGQKDRDKMHQRFNEKHFSFNWFSLSELDINQLKSELEKNDLKEFFWTEIINSDVTIKDLKKALKYVGKYKDDRLKVLDDQENEQSKIYFYINSNFKGGEYTNTEIYDMLIEDEIISKSITPNMLGRILKSKYKQKIASTNQGNKRLYYF
jgi:hypothetical protein